MLIHNRFLLDKRKGTYENHLVAITRFFKQKKATKLISKDQLSDDLFN